jgi:probable F420-dependent oxidoreductase
MKLGVSQANSPASASLEILRAAEDAGFDQFWFFDSHVIWQECYSMLGWLVGKSRSDRMQFGTMVTNPNTRDPIVTASAFATLSQVTGGRMICGIGRGDSVVRVLKRKPANLGVLEESINLIRTLGRGERLDLDGVPVQIEWAEGGFPIYVAAYGPKALRLAGRVGDGVIFQVADPYFIQWGMEQVRAGAEEVGRDLSGFTIHCAAATFISPDRDEAREHVRWFPALVGNHIADVLRHRSAEELPAELFDYVQSRVSYNYLEHGHPGAEHSKYVPDEIVDRFCVIGTEEECAEKLVELAQLGVGEFNIYPYVPDLEGVIEAYGKRIGPAVNSGVTA